MPNNISGFRSWCGARSHPTPVPTASAPDFQGQHSGGRLGVMVVFLCRDEHRRNAAETRKAVQNAYIRVVTSYDLDIVCREV